MTGSSRSLALQPSARYVSEVWRSPGGVALLLGSARNSAAAIADKALLGFEVAHIVCVASSRNARTLANAQRVAGQSRPGLSVLHMQDMLRQGERVEIETHLADHLTTLERAMDEARGSPEPPRAVLVHCDVGINRSPALVLAFLLRCNLSLREAYRHVLRARPGIDPLPQYRHALQVYERQLHHASTVFDDELFGMHLSELIDHLEGSSLEKSDDKGGEFFERAFARRDGSIQALLREPESGASPHKADMAAAGAGVEEAAAAGA
mmetsp:Transcript_101975/g.288766  ORF Transcript_101975/g.288766 Transcript_101975/m.288766 type:complete len:266 (-) Transcript_101975:257-1054(-)